MATGTVKWFNATKGFGFIQPDAGGPDVFVHISAVERAGMRDLNEGQKIAYEVVADKRSEEIIGRQFVAGLKMENPSLRRSDASSARELAHMRSTGTEHMVLDVREARELAICQLASAVATSGYPSVTLPRVTPPGRAHLSRRRWPPMGVRQPSPPRPHCLF